MKTLLLGFGDIGDMTEEEDAEDEEKVVTAEETVVDLPTYDLSLATMPGYS